MIITISGTPGSGKSTIAKILQQKLSAKRIYVGGIRREIARKKSMTLEELNQYAQTHPETDVDVDQQVAAQAQLLDKKRKIVVVEGRTQFHFLPKSIKVYIKVDSEEGARRIWKDLQNQQTREQRNEGNIFSFAQMKKRIRERLQEDNERYKKYYRVEYLDESNYDLVIDTTKITAEQAAEKIIKFIKGSHN
ncbi:MAG TPA: AAA family ATPase [Candidatus Nanoarchaeia archaeon]|nr:AAA family ATPase [Candidatus Nanoarchaeia archaeon]